MLKKQQKGLSLIELLIGLLVGTIVAAGAISVFTGSVKSSGDNINLTRLNQDLRAMMDIMERDIRRAGYVTSDPATNLASVSNNPFFNPVNPLFQTVSGGAITDIAVYDGGNCIVYAYNRDDDANNDGVTDEIPSVVDNNEQLGFRLNNGELEMRQSGTTNANCTDVNNSWQSITEPEVEITTLTFALAIAVLNVTDTDANGTMDSGDDNGNGSCDSGEACNTCTRNGSPDPACLYIRTLTITLAGRLRDDPTVTQTITERVRVRNDKFLAAN